MLPIFLLLLVYLHTATKATANVITTNQEDHNKNFQDVLKVLSSIEQYLAKLDEDVRTSKYVSDLVEATGRKVDKLEATLRNNIPENNSNNVITKIDSICERTQHRLTHLEMKVESAEKKLSEKMDLLMARFDKMEDTVTTRESDIEEEIVEVLSVMDDIKISVEPTALKAVIKETVDTLRQDFVKTGNELQDSFEKLQMSDKVQEIQGNIKRMATVLNLTRYEQQNSFRNVVVQVGRIGGKNLACNSHSDNVQLKQMNDSILSNLENMFLLQTTFLESCHRVQMDEVQIESKISEVLETLIETFQDRDLQTEIKNFQLFLKAHDTSMKRNIFTNGYNAGILFQKEKKSKDDLKAQLMRIDQEIKSTLGGINDVVFKINETKLCTLHAKNLENVDNTQLKMTTGIAGNVTDVE